MSDHKSRNRPSWPETNAEAAELIRDLKTVSPADAEVDFYEEAAVPDECPSRNEVNLDRLFATLKARDDRSEWWAVTGRGGVNPLVRLIRDACDSIRVTVLPPASAAERAESEPLKGRLLLTHIWPARGHHTELAPNERLNALGAADAVGSLACDDEEDDGGFPLVDFDEEASDDSHAKVGTDGGDDSGEADMEELKFELELPDLPATTRVLHVEVAELTDPELTSADLTDRSAVERRSMIDIPHSAILTARRTGIGHLEITTTREELATLATSETAAFGLVCVQEGGDADV